MVSTRIFVLPSCWTINLCSQTPQNDPFWQVLTDRRFTTLLKLARFIHDSTFELRPMYAFRASPPSVALSLREAPLSTRASS